jgi:hypothetical protein
MEQNKNNDCPCCNRPWLQCPKAPKAALDGRIAYNHSNTFWSSQFSTEHKALTFTVHPSRR